MPRHHAQGTYAKALVEALRAAPRRKAADEGLRQMAAAVSDPDLAAYLEALAEHRAYTVDMGSDFEMDRGIAWVDDAQRRLVVAMTAGGDQYVADRDDGDRIVFVSHETPHERNASVSFEDLLWQIVWDLRDRGGRTAICDAVGDGPPD